MGRERQKAKRRSGISKAVRKPKSKKLNVLHPIIAANWDKSQTLAQNYRRLGLAAQLNRSTGGREKRIADVPASDGHGEANPDDPLAIGVKSAGLVPGVTEVQIERDTVTGAIVRVLEDPRHTKPNPLDDPLNDLSDPEEDDSQYAFGALGRVPKKQANVRDTQVTGQLEQLAGSGLKKRRRHQSKREQEWVQRLVERHGEDYGAMFRDAKLNVMQLSEGDLRRRVRLWSEGQALGA